VNEKSRRDFAKVGSQLSRQSTTATTAASLIWTTIPAVSASSLAPRQGDYSSSPQTGAYRHPSSRLSKRQEHPVAGDPALAELVFQSALQVC
jgi:hypothetical protein